MAAQPLQFPPDQRAYVDGGVTGQQPNLHMPSPWAKAPQRRLDDGCRPERVHCYLSAADGDIPYPIGRFVVEENRMARSEAAGCRQGGRVDVHRDDPGT
ncbi:MAG: hypothetical protein QOE89_1659 [Pseudonocardiales bacterium]|nr:hypothetical protein [Pseudonocardiales bacterium]